MSDEQRRLSTHFDHQLCQSRRHGLSQGLHWFWAVNLWAILFLLARFYVYRDDYLVIACMQPGAVIYRIKGTGRSGYRLAP
ncbi:hypothetical protein KAT72_12620 [Aeromonas popoffii]|uniref:Inner membrane protein n=1 Tax=Aeromonas popoffii TaxID=70856 RepID=A0ABS5GRT4_9GAMM|nr:hypothetical protein [Aeromonas popoffii]MBR7629845.1 hypothetical protein [Aeromonas popoffii]